MTRYIKYFNQVILGIVILLALLVLASSLRVFGRQSFVVESGSMSPKIGTGSVVFDHTAASYKVGDVITFRETNSRDTVTHRIVSVKRTADGQIFYTVKGDANPTPDADPVAKSNVVGKVGFSVPYVGYVIGFLKTLYGLMLFIVVPGVIIIYREIMKIWEEIKTKSYRSHGYNTDKGSQSAADRRAKQTAKIIPAIFFLAVLAMLSLPTKAYSSDTADLSSISISTGSWTDQ
ncbi:MAG TPA: signal peptidase I [Candidatus Saccharimonadales bacterium]|nr:signal peptidase I [Candidatus Saccharimonadales bacterium]